MAQTTQVIPKYPFPYTETIINDYTSVNDDVTTSDEDNSIKQAYAFKASKGIDNTWVRKANKAAAVQSFGKSNFKKFGQPLMQAMNVVNQDNTTVWMMRVMPEDATFSNTSVIAWYLADSASDFSEDPSKMKFHIAFTGRNYRNVRKISTISSLVKDDIDNENFTIPKFTVSDGEEETEVALGSPINIMNINYTGRGRCGNLYSLRMTTVPTYEKELGIKMYNFESITSENGLVKDATYVGSLVTSEKYGSETVTLIDDLLSDTAKGVAPININSKEDNVEAVYDAYMTWINEEYRPAIDSARNTAFEALNDGVKDLINSGVIPTKSNIASIPGIEDVDAEYAKYLEYKKFDVIYEEIQPSELPDYDQFDIFFGTKIGVNMSSADPTDFFPGYVVESISNVDDLATANWVAEKKSGHTDDFVVNPTAVKGITLSAGHDGLYDPYYVTHYETDIETGDLKENLLEGQTRDEEGTLLYISDVDADLYTKAYDGTFDPLILSSKRMEISAFFDANYPFETKTVINDLCLTRNYCRCWLDVGIIEALDYPVLQNLISDYGIFTDKLTSVDIHNYTVREDTTNKKRQVTITYFLSAAWCNHITYVGFQYPFARKYCQLEGHIRDSLRPVVEDYDVTIKTKLYEKRFNYFECIKDNVFQRGTQNTRQIDESDLLEENDVQILYTFKNRIELDLNNILYDFSSASDRATFINTEDAIYNGWKGSIVEDLNMYFNVSQWEFNHQIIHLYVDMVFRGLNKRALLEIDLNKREYADNLVSAEID